MADSGFSDLVIIAVAGLGLVLILQKLRQDAELAATWPRLGADPPRPAAGGGSAPLLINDPSRADLVYGPIGGSKLFPFW